jgi:hypothetical protein
MFAVDKILSKHKNLTIIMARGNHDSDTAIALALILKFYYSKETTGQHTRPSRILPYSTVWQESSGGTSRR